MPSDKNPTPRWAILALVGAVLFGVCLDPYTLHHDVTDLVVPGPWWQIALGIVDLSLLGTETLWATGSALILVGRDAMGRFVRGFGAEPYLAEYLIVMGIRAVAITLLWRAARRAASIAATPAAQR